MPTQRQVYTASWFYFENILKPQLEANGQTFPGGVKQVAQQFSYKWRDLDPLEKRRIKDMAAEYRRTPECKERLDKTKKFVEPKPIEGRKERIDTAGDFLENRVDYAKLFADRRSGMKEKLLTSWFNRYKAYLNGVIGEKNYFIAFEWYCQCHDGNFLPAEVAIAEFSLANGISRLFHKIIFPVEIPTGMSAIAKIISSQSHKIDPHVGLQENENGDYNNLVSSNCDQILHAMADVITNSPNSNGQTEPTRLFCCFDHHGGVQSCLDYLKQRCTDPQLKEQFSGENLFCVEDLLECYKRWKQVGNGDDITPARINDLLRTSKYDFTANTRCRYHDCIDNVDCAEATVRRQCFTFVEALRESYAFSITKNHTPFECQLRADMQAVQIPSTKELERFRLPRAKPVLQPADAKMFPVCKEELVGPTCTVRIHSFSPQNLQLLEKLRTAGELPLQRSFSRASTASVVSAEDDNIGVRLAGVSMGPAAMQIGVATAIPARSGLGRGRSRFRPTLV